MDEREAKNRVADVADKAKEMGQDAIENGYKAGKEYADAGREYAEAGLEYANELGDSLRSFVRREPWIALSAACLVGYLAARLLRSVK
jgi:hypothetical protein